MDTRKILNMDEVSLVRKYLELLTDTKEGREIISDKSGLPIFYSMYELGELIKDLKK